MSGQRATADPMAKEEQQLLACRMTTAFQFVALQEESNLYSHRPQPDWEVPL